LKKTPVIILSNAHMTSLAQEAAAIGAERAMLKSSCTPGQLLDEICGLLSGMEMDTDPMKRLSVPSLPPTPQS
jgi:DNA-binding NarL/FixJ family response regulator